jgi:cell wall assembly regulator SMI1
MARYYSEDDIKEVLKTLVRESRYQHDGEDYYAGVSQVAGEILTLQPADVAPKNVWINVDERLPENDTTVLCYNGVINTYTYEEKNKWWADSCWDTTKGFGITHWMPLPEPPKGD